MERFDRDNIRREGTVEGWKKKLCRRLAAAVEFKVGSVQSIVEDMVLSAGKKWSYRLNVWIMLRSILTEQGCKREKWWKKLEERIHESLLWEDPKKAPRLSMMQLHTLLGESSESYAVANALILPSGMRFADAARIRVCDIVSLKKGVATVRVRRTKTIRRRRHQRWLSLAIPLSLLPALRRRIKEATPTAPLVAISYSSYLRYLKRKLGPMVATYSLRRTVLNIMAERVQNIEQLQEVTFHRTKEQLRWYLDKPLPDELSTQVHATSWHLDMFGH
jgi:integrase